MADQLRAKVLTPGTVSRRDSTSIGHRYTLFYTAGVPVVISLSIQPVVETNNDKSRVSR